MAAFVGGTILTAAALNNAINQLAGQTVALTSPAAATVPFTVTGAASQSANLVELKSSAGTVVASISVAGVVTANGSGLTNLNASNLASGTVPAARIDGSTLTSLNASNLASGTVPSARVSGSYTGITAVGTLTGLTIGGAGSNRSITINAPTGYYAIQYFAINGTNEWHYEVPPSGSSWSLVESGVAERLRMDADKLYVFGQNANSPQLELGDWNQDGRYSALRSQYGYLLLGSGINSNIYLRTEAGAGAVYIGGSNTNTLEVTSTSATLNGFLNVDGASSQNIRIGDWTGGASYSVIENAYGYLLMGAAGDQRMYLRTYANDVRIGTPSSDTLIVSGTNVSINKPINAQLEVSNTNVYISGTGGAYFQHASNTGSGQACQWATVFGIYYLVRNTSTKADKENVQPLNGVLTPQMVDAIDVSLWNRKIAPGIPEVGPMAEDMDEISPFLATHGMDVDEYGEICRTPPNGVSPNGWMSLLTIALQDCRRRISVLEGAS